MMSMQGDQAPGGAVTSDASGSWGCGAYSGSQWFQLQWNDNLLNKSIAVKEMVPIIIAAACNMGQVLEREADHLPL